MEGGGRGWKEVIVAAKAGRVPKSGADSKPEWIASGGPQKVDGEAEQRVGRV